MAESRHIAIFYYDESGYYTHPALLERGLDIPNNASTERPIQVKPKYENGVWVESATSEEILLKVQEEEYNKYHLRIKDGIDAIARFSAEMRALKLAGIINEDSHKVIDTQLEPIRNKLIAGQWIDAIGYLESIGTAVIGVGLYNKIHNELGLYISQNY